MVLSNNAEPLLMGRFTRVVPARLPGFLSLAGPYRMEVFVGRQEGGSAIPHPLIFGQKITFKVAPYLEIGYGRTFILGAGDTHLGSPFTFGNFFDSFIAKRGAGRVRGIPGDNRDSLDFTLRLPISRVQASIYAELYADDKPIYLVLPSRGAYRAGIYLAQLPGLPKFSFRAESTSTESPAFPSRAVSLNYWNSQYRDGYTNEGVLLGNAVGREGRGIQAWVTYHAGPRHSLEFSFTHRQVDPGFVPGGGRWQDYAVRHEYFSRSGIYVRSSVQYEHIPSFPILFSGRVNNLAVSLELGFSPEAGKQ